MLKGVLFDLGNTVVMFPALGLESENSTSEQKSMLESLVRVMYDSLARNHIDVEWPAFWEAHGVVRAEQIRLQKQTLREYDMFERLARILGALGFKISPGSRIIRQTLNDYFESYVKHVRIEKKTIPILKSLHLYHKLGLVTNFAYPPCIHTIIEKFNLKQFFDVVVVSGEVGWVKPSPKIFHTALSKLGLKAYQVVFVGDDHETDIKGAKGVGMKTVFLSRGKTCYDADKTISHLSNLPDAVEELERVDTTIK
jgi:putative hydrolase of the HAD superfamily